MVSLLIETSQNSSFIALVSEGKLLDIRTFLQTPEALKVLLPSIQTLLQQNSCSLQEVERIGVGVGPGSYTGTRVGVTVASTLAYARSLPLVSFCSLFAYIPENEEGVFAHVMPSKRGDYFVAKGIKNGNHELIVESQGFISLDAIGKVDFLVCETELPLSVQTVKPQCNLPPLLPLLAKETPSPKVDVLYLIPSSFH